MTPTSAPEHRDKAARWDTVLTLLQSTKRLSVHDVAQQLGISQSTVRRDFVEMERAQLARRTHGGIVAIDVAYSLATVPRSTDSAATDRERVATAAAALVRPGQIVGFNGGRTTTSTARRIVGRADLEADDGRADLEADDGRADLEADDGRADLEADDGRAGLTVVCAALNIATEAVLRPNVRTVVLGGVAEPYSFELTGPLATATMRDLWLDTMFVGTIGVDVDAGLTCHSEAEAAVTRVMIGHARRVVGLATADKVGVRALAGICPLAALTDLVLSGTPDPTLRDALREHEVRLHTV